MEASRAFAMHLHSIAAERGSEMACYELAHDFSAGIAGVLPKDAHEATRWYRAMESARVRDATSPMREEAAAWLREHATVES